MTKDPWIMRSIIWTLEFILVAVTLAFVTGLFNTSVDNAQIFEILKPAVGTIIGSFMTILAYESRGKGDTKETP